MKILITILAALILTSCTATEQNPNIITIEGSFHNTLETTHQGNMMYQFRADDNTVWWLLSESEIGHIPNNEDTYILTYDNCGTTAENKPCDCIPEWECECELYDDEFISIKKAQE